MEEKPDQDSSLFNSELFSDIKLLLIDETSETEFPAHISILANKSNFFLKLFSFNNNDRKNGQITIDISGIGKVSAALEIIDWYIYNDEKYLSNDKFKYSNYRLINFFLLRGVKNIEPETLKGYKFYGKGPKFATNPDFDDPTYKLDYDILSRILTLTIDSWNSYENVDKFEIFLYSHDISFPGREFRTETIYHLTLKFDKQDDIRKIFEVLYNEKSFVEEEAYEFINEIISDHQPPLKDFIFPYLEIQGYDSGELLLSGSFINSKGIHKNHLNFFLQWSSLVNMTLEIQFYSSHKKDVDFFLKKINGHVVIDERAKLINNKLEITITDKKSIWRIFISLIRLGKLPEKERLLINTFLMQDSALYEELI